MLASREFISPESLRYSQCSAGTRHARASAAGPSAGFEDQLQVEIYVFFVMNTIRNSNGNFGSVLYSMWLPFLTFFCLFMTMLLSVLDRVVTQ